MQRFEATIVEARGGGAYVEVPSEVLSALGGGGRIPVQATFDGVDYRGSVVTMGGVRCIGVLKAIRQSLDKGPGDTVVVTLSADVEERTVDVPGDLQAALSAAGVADAFSELSYSHRREYVAWIDEAKRPATQARRVAETVERLSASSP